MAGKANPAEVAQWQSTFLVRTGSRVRFPSSAPSFLVDSQNRTKDLSQGVESSSLLLYNLLTMNYIATITSKRQLTLPSKLTQKLNIKSGEKVAIREEKGYLVLVPTLKAVEELAGSLKLPDRFKGLDSQEIIKKAKEEYFSK